MIARGKYEPLCSGCRTHVSDGVLRAALGGTLSKRRLQQIVIAANESASVPGRARQRPTETDDEWEDS